MLFGGALAAGLLFTAYSLYADISEAGTPVRTYLPFLLLGVALLIALGFEFVNGFHDTANAIATVVSTGVLPPRTAIMIAAIFNFAGAFLGTGVAQTIGGDIALPTSITQTTGRSAASQGSPVALRLP